MKRALRAALIIFIIGTLCGCASTGHLAPKAPDQPWQQPGSKATARKFELATDPNLTYQGEEGLVDSTHVYSLPELIDLAERVNPDTRIAWEEARQAAFAVGLAQATYLPQLSAEVLAGVQHTPLPIPQSVEPRGYFNADTNEVLPGFVLKWLLFDFGKRGGIVDAATQNSVAANIAFTGAHQKLIFEVSKAYFTLDAIRAELRVAEDAVKSATTLQDSAEAKKKRGLETITELAMARRSTAKAQFDLERAKAADHDAFHDLLEAIGLKPTLHLQIAPSSGRDLPESLSTDVNAYIERALSRRPDVLARFAKVRASEAEVRSAEATYYPSIGLEGYANQNIGSLSIDGGPSYRVNEPAASILLKISLPLYDGGTRRNASDIARSKSAAARDELLKVQDEAIRQVAKTYDAVKSSLAEYNSALALVKASDTAFFAAMDSYRHGVGTITNAVTTQTEKVQAHAAQAQAYASVLTSAAALAFSTGELTSAETVGSFP